MVASTSSGNEPDEKRSRVLNELFTQKLLKLDSIQGGEEVRRDRKAQVGSPVGRMVMRSACSLSNTLLNCDGSLDMIKLEGLEILAFGNSPLIFDR